MKKKIKYFVFTTILLIITASFIVPKMVLPYAIIQPPRVTMLITPSEVGLKSIDVNIITKDSINLKGYWIKSDSLPTKSVIIFLQGIGGCKEPYLPLSKKLLTIGVESILLDSRAHGKSSGQFCTYGYKEKKDIAEIVDFIKQNNDSIKIGVWGNSMGGAIALQALEYDKRIEFGIVESTFTDLRQIVYDYQKSATLNIGFKYFCDVALDEAGNIAGFNPDKVSPIKSTTNITQPILIAHGDNDQKIKFEYGKRLFDELKSKNKEFLPVKGGGHFNLAKVGGAKYEKSIENFILKQVD